MNVRRVVTGHDPSGKSVFVSDETVEHAQPSMMPTVAFHQLWGGDTTPQFPDDGSMPQWNRYFPPIGGFRFGLITLATGAEQPDVNVEQGLADLESARRTWPRPVPAS